MYSKIAVLTTPPLPDWGKAVWQMIKEQGGQPKFCQKIEEAKSGDWSVGWLRFVPSDRDRIPEYWAAAEHLESAGIPLINSMSSRSIASDKWANAQAFMRRSLPHPRTWLIDQRSDIPSKYWPLVCKPLTASQGYGVVLVNRPSEAISHQKRIGSQCLLQERIDAKSCLRVIATPEQVIRVYEKKVKPGILVASIALGAERAKPIDSNDQINNLAQEMVAAVGGDLMGVDILVDQNNNLYALEVNGSFAFDYNDRLVASAMAKKIMQLARS